MDTWSCVDLTAGSVLLFHPDAEISQNKTDGKICSSKRGFRFPSLQQMEIFYQNVTKKKKKN